MWLEMACLRVGSVEVNSTSVGVVWFSESKLDSLRPLHSDSSEKVRCRVRLGDYKEKSKRDQSCVCTFIRIRLFGKYLCVAHWISLWCLSRVVHDDQSLQVIFNGAFVSPAWRTQVP